MGLRLAGRRVLITGAARGIGAALARRLYARGASVSLLGLEADLLAGVAADCGDAPWRECDVADPDAVRESVDALAAATGGLDVAVANAGVAAQWSVLHGDLAVLETLIRVNTLGVCHTIRAAAPHLVRPGGYVLAISSLAAAVHLPLLGAYSVSKAAVEALGNTARLELSLTGTRVGVAYFAELATDMTTRGFATDAAAAFFGPRRTLREPTPLPVAIDALERGITRRAARIYVPRWAAAVVTLRQPVQWALEIGLRGPRLRRALAVAETERGAFTTTQPGRDR